MIFQPITGIPHPGVFGTSFDSEGNSKPTKPAEKGKAAVKTTKRAFAPGASTLPSSASAVAAAPPKASKKSKLAKFADVVREEEVTRQKEINLATIRAKQSLKELELKLKLTKMKEKGCQEDKSASGFFNSAASSSDAGNSFADMDLDMSDMGSIDGSDAGSSHGSVSFGNIFPSFNGF
ncbi:hypothetical protein C8R45DRAFT_1193600 [Mycena sanguinolenta]|nr:hypothetical protein C8R45DRAFT_1193600 [Mycena sanguinolenta]